MSQSGFRFVEFAQLKKRSLRGSVAIEPRDLLVGGESGGAVNGIDFVIWNDPKFQNADAASSDRDEDTYSTLVDEVLKVSWSCGSECRECSQLVCIVDG